MCHGLIDECATVPVPDLLRAVIYENLDDKSYVDDYLSVFGSDLLLPESSDLADDGALAGIVNDYSLGLKKFDAEDVANIGAAELTESLSIWFDCIKDGLFSVTDSVPAKPAADPLAANLLPQETLNTVKVAPKSRKARKSSAAVKEQSHAQHNSEMDHEAPVLIDEKRKRRMSSNRLSAQRSRQRKQERLDELEILTAQLRLENATLSRRSKLAEQVAKKFQSEKNALAKKVKELKQDLEAIRHSSPQGLADPGDESKDVNYMVEGGKSSSDTSVLELETLGNSDNVSTNFDAKKRNISSTDLSCSMFQELYDAIDSHQFDVSVGAEVQDLLQEEWFGTFTKCLNAGD